MQNKTATLLTILSLSAVTTSAFAGDDSYIPWTFDDFDSNCQVIDATGAKLQKPASTQAENDAYIPWTFDDFNSNCEVVDATES